jgi:hypothetical protein
MTAVRDFLLETLGGSQTMWDVFLGILLAMIVIGIISFVFAMVIRITDE